MSKIKDSDCPNKMADVPQKRKSSHLVVKKNVKEAKSPGHAASAIALTLSISCCCFSGNALKSRRGGAREAEAGLAFAKAEYCGST